MERYQSAETHHLKVITDEHTSDIYGYGTKQPMSKCPEFYYREHGVAADIIGKFSTQQNMWLTIRSRQ
jgi:hypothetical protein